MNINIKISLSPNPKAETKISTGASLNGLRSCTAAAVNDHEILWQPVVYASRAVTVENYIDAIVVKLLASSDSKMASCRITYNFVHNSVFTKNYVCKPAQILVSVSVSRSIYTSNF